MKKLLTILVLTMAVHAYGQDTTGDTTATSKRNGWYIEAGGQSILGVTFNYERYLSKKPGGLSVHAGFGGGYLPDIFDDGITAFGAIPAGISYNIPLTANKQHFLETGVGYTLLFASGGSASLGSAITSYRYQSASGNIQVRATILPAVFLLGGGGGGAIPWVGFSIGKRF